MAVVIHNFICLAHSSLSFTVSRFLSFLCRQFFHPTNKIVPSPWVPQRAAARGKLYQGQTPNRPQISVSEALSSAASSPRLAPPKTKDASANHASSPAYQGSKHSATNSLGLFSSPSHGAHGGRREPLATVNEVQASPPAATPKTAQLLRPTPLPWPQTPPQNKAGSQQVQQPVPKLPTNRPAPARPLERTTTDSASPVSLRVPSNRTGISSTSDLPCMFADRWWQDLFRTAIHLKPMLLCSPLFFPPSPSSPIYSSGGAQSSTERTTLWPAAAGDACASSTPPTGTLTRLESDCFCAGA